MSARHRKCPTPEKVQYQTFPQALHVLRRLPSDRAELRPYRCRKHWHLTSRPS